MFTNKSELKKKFDLALYLYNIDNNLQKALKILEELANSEDITVKYKAKFNIAKHLLDTGKDHKLNRKKNRKSALELLKDTADNGIEEARKQYEKELKNEKQFRKKIFTKHQFKIITQLFKR
ncbi:45562_t:CDS:1 [Gigaspora margarita]|uniref:45562_t:CDS:1 n=2 Tax=Gigaspora margarita TaxID=4874 RepID=A0ABM8W663_GIGMA|nr:45562_t:CDS:1 [Gigaspora margarita]